MNDKICTFRDMHIFYASSTVYLEIFAYILSCNNTGAVNWFSEKDLF